MTERAVLAVSFGTSHRDTLEKNIAAIEAELAAAFPERTVRRAFTSGMILRKLAGEGTHIDNVPQALERLLAEGCTDVVVQPTHVINGIENDRMKEDALSFRDSFHSISFGDPLLTTEDDSHKVIAAIAREFSHITKDQALVFMGHGTTHFANSIYAALDYTFKDKGYHNFFLGTVEAYPSMESLKKMVKAYRPKEVVLAPFMIVAGDHAKNDMAGDDPESWYSQFKDEGYEVKTVLKGLGEYEGIRSLFIDHIRAIDR